MTGAFPGAAGSFSEAMSRVWYPDALRMACRTFDDAFARVEGGEADAAVIPLENSLTGRIGPATERLMTSPLHIMREGTLKIEHCLIAQEGACLEDIRRIYGHPEALAQCRLYLERLGRETISWWDGAGAVQEVRADPSSALVGNAGIAASGGLAVLAHTIQDYTDNYTRFVALSREEASPTGRDKTTISFTLSHRPGSLVRALAVFDAHGINLTRLSSMPVREEPWSYAFIADFEGHADDAPVKGALSELSEVCAKVRFHGSYPRMVG